MKLVLGPKYKDNYLFAEKLKELKAGQLDEYNCFVYIPADTKANKQFTQLKVKDIKKYMLEVYTDELFGMIDIEEFVKNEIEQKAIVVIDEIDKLVRSVTLTCIILLGGFSRHDKGK